MSAVGATVTGFSDPIAGLTALTISAYGFAVLLNGNGDKLIAALHADMFSDGRDGFLKWLIAVAIVLSLGGSATLKPLVGPLYATTLIAMLLHMGQDTDFFAKVAKTWASL